MVIPVVMSRDDAVAYARMHIINMPINKAHTADMQIKNAHEHY